jgi:uncharacterized protein YndB with AHSA1/START domain
MMIDVDHQISAVERSVGDRVLEAGTARVVTVSQVYDATLEELWDACTSAERIPRWFMPISGDLRLGGRYQLEGNAGGTIERCDPPRSFAATWEYGGEVSWIETRLEPDGDRRTRLTLEHVAHVDDERWLQYGPGAVGVGWDGALMGLGLFVRGEAVGDPVAAANSPEVIEFNRHSIDRWVAATEASGAATADEIEGGKQAALAQFVPEPDA